MVLYFKYIVSSTSFKSNALLLFVTFKQKLFQIATIHSKGIKIIEKLQLIWEISTTKIKKV